MAECYADDAVLMHPKKPLIQGRAAIVDFLRGGMGKAAVDLTRRELHTSAGLAFEHGTYRDSHPHTRAPLAAGYHLVVWQSGADGVWRIKSHSWNSPS